MSCRRGRCPPHFPSALPAPPAAQVHQRPCTPPLPPPQAVLPRAAPASRLPHARHVPPHLQPDHRWWVVAQVSCGGPASVCARAPSHQPASAAIFQPPLQAACILLCPIWTFRTYLYQALRVSSRTRTWRAWSAACPPPSSTRSPMHRQGGRAGTLVACMGRGAALVACVLNRPLVVAEQLCVMS